MTNRERIHKAALEVLEAHPDGIRYSALQLAVQAKLPNVPPNTIQGNTWNLEVTEADAVVKPARGLYVLRRYYSAGPEPPKPPPPGAKRRRVREEEFYESFASWLVTEVEECTRAIPVGGNLFRDKWGTPDVIGIREPRKSDIVKPGIEITAAEIKLDSAGLITAFGQACAYKVFAHRSYIVVPRASSKADLDRLEALCLIFGVGLVLFDAASPTAPTYDIRTRPQKHEPDMFYVNEKMKLVENKLF